MLSADVFRRRAGFLWSGEGLTGTQVVSFQRKFIYGHIETKLRGLHNSLQSFIFCGYSIVMTYLRGFQLVRIFFQPERIARVFNSGELGLILASIDNDITSDASYLVFRI